MHLCRQTTKQGCVSLLPRLDIKANETIKENYTLPSSTIIHFSMSFQNFRDAQFTPQLDKIAHSYPPLSKLELNITEKLITCKTCDLWGHIESEIPKLPSLKKTLIPYL